MFNALDGGHKGPRTGGNDQIIAFDDFFLSILHRHTDSISCLNIGMTLQHFHGTALENSCDTGLQAGHYLRLTLHDAGEIYGVFGDSHTKLCGTLHRTDHFSILVKDLRGDAAFIEAYAT